MDNDLLIEPWLQDYVSKSNAITKDEALNLFLIIRQRNIQKIGKKIEDFHISAINGNGFASYYYESLKSGYEKYHNNEYVPLNTWCLLPSSHGWNPTQECGTFIPIVLYNALKEYIDSSLLNNNFIWTWSGSYAWSYMHCAIALNSPDSRDNKDYGLLTRTKQSYALGKDVPISGVYRIMAINSHKDEQTGNINNYYECYYSRTTPNHYDDFVKEIIPLYTLYDGLKELSSVLKIGDVIRIKASFEQTKFNNKPWTKKTFQWEFYNEEFLSSIHNI